MRSETANANNPQAAPARAASAEVDEGGILISVLYDAHADSSAPGRRTRVRV